MKSEKWDSNESQLFPVVPVSLGTFFAFEMVWIYQFSLVFSSPVFVLAFSQLLSCLVFVSEIQWIYNPHFNVFEYMIFWNKVQLSLEQKGFELCATTLYEHFFTINTIVLHSLWLVESVEPQIVRAYSKNTWGFLCPL